MTFYYIFLALQVVILYIVATKRHLIHVTYNFLICLAMWLNLPITIKLAIETILPLLGH